jgi:hypothetical protein
LDAEEHEDDVERSKYGDLWRRTPSHLLNDRLREEGAKYRGNLTHSTKSDAFVRKKFSENEKMLIRLCEWFYCFCSFFSLFIHICGQVYSFHNFITIGSAQSIASLLPAPLENSVNLLSEPSAEKLKQLLGALDQNVSGMGWLRMTRVLVFIFKISFLFFKLTPSLLDRAKMYTNLKQKADHEDISQLLLVSSNHSEVIENAIAEYGQIGQEVTQVMGMKIVWD